jgi:hypothetical protein
MSGGLIWYPVTSSQMEDRRRAYLGKRAAPPRSLRRRFHGRQLRPPRDQPIDCHRVQPIRPCRDPIRWQASRVRPDCHQIVVQTPN